MPHTFPQISALDTLAALADPCAPVLLDIRLPEDVDEDPTRLPTAQAVAFDDFERHCPLAEPHGAIVICHKGLKLSAGVTARLNAKGIAARRLQGGHVAWTQAGLLTVDRDGPQIIALPLEATASEALAAWATLRFLAPRAELLEVPRDDLAGVVQRFGAQAPQTLPQILGLTAMHDAMPAVALALGAARPSQTFAMLDLAYRGALRHETITGPDAKTPVSTGVEAQQ